MGEVGDDASEKVFQHSTCESCCFLFDCLRQLPNHLHIQHLPQTLPDDFLPNSEGVEDALETILLDNRIFMSEAIDPSLDDLVL